MKKIRKITDIGTVIQAIFAEEPGAIRVAESGLEWSPIGSLATAKRVGVTSPIRIFNSSGAIAYVAFGDEAMLAPTGPTDGIPVPGGAVVVLNSGAKNWVRSSAGTVYGYQGDLV